MLYFSYGSNMSSRRLAERVPSARFITVGRLFGHELRFHKIGKDGSGKCDAAVVNNGSAVIIGVVFDLAEAEKPILDRYEGLGAGYEEKSVIVISDKAKSLAAVTYYATHIAASIRPFLWYKEHVITGAREHNLPRHYISGIEAITAIADPDSKRHARELSIYR